MLKFISFLGTNEYVPCNYYLGEFKAEACNYIQDALIKILIQAGYKPDKAIILITEQARNANWIKNRYDNSMPGLEKTLNTLLGPNAVKGVYIPNGSSQEELWELFEIILREIDEDDELIFDITHSFRFLPMLAFTAISYARVVKKCKIQAIYYGAFESLGTKNEVEQMPMENRNAPIFNLTPFVDLFDWTLGIDRYIHTGDASIISELTKSEVKRLNQIILLKNNDKKQDLFKDIRTLRELADCMKEFSDNVFTCRGKNLTESVLKLKKALDDVIAKASQEYIKPFIPIISMLQERFSKFSDDNYTNVLETARWCWDNRMYQQGLTILEEGIISYICDALHIDKTEYECRELVSKYAKLIHDKYINVKNIKAVDDVDFVQRLMPVLYDIADVRNDINHAGWRKNARDLTTFEKQLKDFINRSQKPAANETEGKRMLLIFSHELLPMQEQEAKERFGITDCVPLPPELLNKWSNIPPALEKLDEYLADILNWIDCNARSGDYVLVQGDFGATMIVVNYCFAKSLTPVYATTKRVVNEERVDDKVIISKQFQHVMFREYHRPDQI